MSINITDIGAAGLHSFRAVNVNSEDNYVYFKNSDIPSEIIESASYIYNDGIGSIQGLGEGSLVFTQIDNDQFLTFADDPDREIASALDITGATAGNVALNSPVVVDGKVSIGISTPSNQAVKYLTTGTPLSNLVSGDTYFLKNVPVSFSGILPLYQLEQNGTPDTFTFTTCGQTGRLGPTLTDIQGAYTSAWHNTADNYLRLGAYQGYQDWVVPVSGIYEFDVKGAAAFEGSGAGTTGRGARVRGKINLTRGEIITIAVGQKGEAPNSGSIYGGSGGGTFVVRKQGLEPLFVAGGGSADAGTTNGKDGQTTIRGGTGAFGNPGGANGFGGPSTNGRSGGGGGFFSRGQDAVFGVGPTVQPGGGAFVDGLVANSATNGGNGGFGGGAAGNPIDGQSGGGGGYSGGAGSLSVSVNSVGGSGGSFITRAATDVATSNGQYEEISVFNNTAITNLSSYNSNDGEVTVSLVESFTSGNTVHPTALDAENGTNAIEIEAAGNSFHAFVPINYDIQNNRIHFTSPHGFVSGQAISFNLQTPTPDLNVNTVYYVNRINNFTFELVSPNINFTIPSGRSVVDTIRKIVVNLDLDSINIPSHGFTLNQPIQYSSGDGTVIGGLTNNQTVFVAEVVDQNNFKVKNALASPTPINLTSVGSGTSHSFIFLTVNFESNTIYIPGHNLSSGQAVIYNTNSGDPVGGLVNETTYFVIVEDSNSIRLSTTQEEPNIVELSSVGTGIHSIIIFSINFETNTISVPNHGFVTGELVEYDSRGQTVISGLATNQQYYIINVDKDNVRLASSPENAEDDISIDLQASPAAVGRHTLTSLQQTPDGVYEIKDVPTPNTFIVEARGQVGEIIKIFDPRSTVDLEFDAFFLPAHGFITGTKVLYDQGSDSGPIGGLTDDTEYFVVTINQDYFRLAETLDDALSGIKINITNFGNGSAHKFTTSQLNGAIVGPGNVSVEAGSVLVNGVGTAFSKILKVGDPFTLYPPSNIKRLTFGDANVNTANDRIEIEHDFDSGDYVKFNAGGGDRPLPLTNGYYYYVGVIASSAFQLFLSKEDALSLSNPVNFTSSGTGENFTLDYISPVAPIVRRITAVGSDFQVTVDRPYSDEYIQVAYTYPTFLYLRPSGFALHRPFDGGVEMSTGAKNSFAQIIRQTRKYFRYQSGKGIQTSMAINFKPSIDIERMERFSSSIIECKTRRPHGLISGLTIQISEAKNSQENNSTIYNGSFDVSVVDLTTFRITSPVTVPEGAESKAYGFPQFHVTAWTNGAIRGGMFDFQNGMFFEFDGQKISCVRRSSTQQMAGSVAALRGSDLIFGQNTDFTSQLKEGDGIVLRGQTYRVVDIIDDETMSVKPEYRGDTGIEISFNPETQAILAENKFVIVRHGLSQNLPLVYNSIDGEPIGGLINGKTYYADIIDANSFRLLPNPDSASAVTLSSKGTTLLHSFVPAQSGIIVTKTVDTKVPQEEWSIDKCDGNGPSGYNLDLSKIQMAYMDYSWYGAGKIRFGFKGKDGQVFYAHEFKHNNELFESYFRSGNLPARYEVATFANPTYIPTLFHWGTSVIMDGTFDDDRGYLFTSGSQTLNIEGTTTKSFAANGIDLDTDLITSLTHGFRTQDIIQFQSIAADGFAGLNLQNPETRIVGSNTLEYLTNTEKYRILVNSPDRIHLTPLNAKFTFGANFARSGTTVTVTTPSTHGIPNGAYVGIYGLTNTSFANGAFTANVSNGTTFTYTVPGGPGSLVDITNTALTTNIATITTSGAHGFVTGQSVTIAGATNTVYNGTYVIASTPTSNTFTYSITNANITSAASAGTVALSVESTLESNAVIAEVIDFVTRGNTQYTYFLHPEGSLNNTSGPNYQPLISLRLSPSADSGLTGKLGTRDIINRMQFRMQEIGVSTDELVEVKLLLNGRLNNLSFTPVDSPSLVEIVEHTPQDTISGGVQVYNFQSEGQSTTNLDLDKLFELSNSILGGDNVFPDGPDIITIAVSRLTGNPTRTSAKLSWLEAQA